VNSESIISGVFCGEHFLSRDELILRAKKAASGFKELGVLPGNSIAILMYNDINFIVGLLAAELCEAYAVPINFHSDPEDIEYILNDSAALLLIAHEDLYFACKHVVFCKVLLVETPEALKQRSLKFDYCEYFSDWIESREPWRKDRGVISHSMIYTSGTTGRPKGVKRMPFNERQRKVLRKINEKVLGITPFMRTVIPAPLYHSAPNLYTMSAVKNRAMVVLMVKFDPLEFLSIIERYKITHVQLVPTMMVRLLRLEPEVRNSFDISSLKYIVHAAAPCPIEIKREFIKWFGPIVGEYYGSTETGALTYCDSKEWLSHPGTVGRALEETEIRILDKNLDPVIDGEGEIAARNIITSSFTYQNRESERNEIEKDGFILTGDVGYMDSEGYLYICDRKKDMVICGGANLYPAEIEAKLLRIPGIHDCAVFGIPDDQLGEVLAFAIELEKNADKARILDTINSDFKGFLKPKTVEFCAELPREDSGKIFKRMLRDPYWQGSVRRI
jgi:long-chain acyl-CoA synthetase